VGAAGQHVKSSVLRSNVVFEVVGQSSGTIHWFKSQSVIRCHTNLVLAFVGACASSVCMYSSQKVREVGRPLICNNILPPAHGFRRAVETTRRPRQMAQSSDELKVTMPTGRGVYNCGMAGRWSIV
jgi:hypothetical protein